MNSINSHIGHVLKLAFAFAIALLALFGVQTLASAEEGVNAGNTICEQLPAIEEMFRLGLTPSLNMTEGEGLDTQLKMTEGEGLDTQLAMTEGEGLDT